jgi:hypothetical protein
MLTHSQARSIAEAVWGRGETHSYRTTRPGAFYFSCSGHGGFVIDVACLTDEELVAISPYVNLEEAELFKWGRKSLFSHPYRRRGGRYSIAATRHVIKFILLEEDCDWCLAYLFTGIRHRDKPAKGEDAQRTFDQWITPRKEA